MADAGPLLASVASNDPAHRLAASLVSQIGRDLLVPDPVIVEVDWLLRKRLGSDFARAFLGAVSEGNPRRIPLTSSLFARAVAYDKRYASLDLGLADASVMALAEAESCPILTFDFEDFRAAPAWSGKPWALLVDEATHRRVVGR